MEPEDNNGHPLPFLGQWASTVDGTSESPLEFVYKILTCKIL